LVIDVVLRIGKNVSNAVDICNYTKAEVPSSLIFSFALENVIKKVQANNMEMKLSGNHQLLVCANDMSTGRQHINSE
jgi:hypothetical protein